MAEGAGGAGGFPLGLLPPTPVIIALGDGIVTRMGEGGMGEGRAACPLPGLAEIAPRGLSPGVLAWPLFSAFSLPFLFALRVKTIIMFVSGLVPAVYLGYTTSQGYQN